jgi:hypothetical protein
MAELVPSLHGPFEILFFWRGDDDVLIEHVTKVLSQACMAPMDNPMVHWRHRIDMPNGIEHAPCLLARRYDTL